MLLVGPPGVDGVAVWRVLVPEGVSHSSELVSARTLGQGASVVRISEMHEAIGETPEQARTLLSALDAGYFDFPRRTKLGGVAARVGKSRSSTMALLRRGIRGLVAEYGRGIDRPLDTSVPSALESPPPAIDQPSPGSRRAPEPPPCDAPFMTESI